ncbi:Mitogen-activated protein kinase 15 [Tetrabaena socialis]|uniref:Mitogen-activated protein kinase 15 n=1 Tax=Tetrabaena socialis TaxID=47790 RepID=A0A2J7ZX70_9CHLO|nr:Mitogen-activated protein kinase 15 [Tetrabaena socialis]|eukprot:PNH04856.1 Mitogen-activated protein kinase 15 [Tetrabaena socialis]
MGLISDRLKEGLRGWLRKLGPDEPATEVAAPAPAPRVSAAPSHEVAASEARHAPPPAPAPAPARASADQPRPPPPPPPPPPQPPAAAAPAASRPQQPAPAPANGTNGKAMLDTRDFFAEAVHAEANRYRILEVIGKGSYGVVCSAVDNFTGEKVAIKKITNVFEHVSDATRIVREIKLLRLLKHPDIVDIKHIMLPPSPKDFKDIYVVFELLETDLHQVIKANDDLTPEHHQFFLYQMLRGLKYIHSGLHCVAREPVAQPVSKLAFEFDRRKLTLEDVRDLIYREILEYHPQMLKDYISGMNRPSFNYPSALESFKRQFAHLEAGAVQCGAMMREVGTGPAAPAFRV